MKKNFLVLFAFLLLACAPGEFQIPQSPALRFLERKSGTIAYIGNDGNVHLTDQGATTTKQLTDDVTPESRILYRLPAWSHDSNQLAFIRLEQKSENSINSEIFVANINDESIKRIYESDSEFPIYMNWSPNNQEVSLLSTSASGQNILLKNLFVDGTEPRVLDAGSPFYMSYAPDGTTMLVHKNGVADTEQQLAFLKTEDEIIEFVLDEVPASFQAPAWSPNGQFILLSTVSDDKKQLVLTDSEGENSKPIAEVKLNTAFAWASDSEQFAYILSDRTMQNGAIGSLHIGDVFGREEIVINEDVIGFFWSPDAKQLAYFIPFLYPPEGEGDGTTQQKLYFSMNILDTGNGETREVAVYPPSEEFLSIIPYIDQYHQSVTIWSPDSNNLVISFLSEDDVPLIALVPASGVTEPRFLVEGSFAVWSWE